LNPALRVTPQDDRASWGEIYWAAQVAYPQAHVSWIGAPIGDHFAAEVWVNVPGEGDFFDTVRRVYIDPYTAEVQGATGWFNAQHTLRDFQMGLSMEGRGIYIVGSFSLLLLASTVSALLFYKRWWRGFFTVSG
jgi:uncharacterized iron-regulated membrane protein